MENPLPTRPFSVESFAGMCSGLFGRLLALRPSICSPHSFWKNVLANCKPPPVMIERYLMNFYKYMDSLPEESRDRETDRLRNTEEHFALRRLTGGLMPSFDFIVMPYNLPDEAENHPIIARMKLAVGDLVITANVSLVPLHQCVDRY